MSRRCGNWLLGHGSRRLYSYNYLVAALPKTAESAVTESAVSDSAGPSVDSAPLSGTSKSKPPKSLSKRVITPTQLNAKFRQKEYTAPTAKQLTQAQAFFNNSKVSLEWTLADYSQIPDVRHQQLVKDREREAAMIPPSQYSETLARSKRFGIAPNLLRPLPEVLLLGHTNVGKSSLVNNLLLSKNQAASIGARTEFAYESKQAGYTKTLNCFNVGNKLRIVDSPGYGVRAQLMQGDVVLEYISRRSQLRRAFVAIDSAEGFRLQDVELINHLVNSGVAFEVIFTKVDVIVSRHMPKKAIYDSYAKQNEQEKQKILDSVEEGNRRIVSHYQRLIEGVRLADLVTVPKILFNNASTNRYLTAREGYKEIRAVMAQSCGLVSEEVIPLPDIKEFEPVSGGRRKRRVTQLVYDESDSRL